MVALTSSSLSAANGVSFASSSEIDAKVHLNVDYMLRLSNRELRAAYNIFTANNQTLSSLVAMNIAISVYTIPTLYVSCLNIGMTNAMKNDWGNWIALMCFVPVINIIIWGVYLKFFLLTRKSKGVLSPSARQFLRYFQMAVFFVVHSAVIAKFVIISGYHCHDGVGNILDNFNCNLQRDVRGIPMEEGFLVTLTPLLYVTIPLTSFLGGVEFISHVLTDMKEVKTLRKVFTSSEIDDFASRKHLMVANFYQSLPQSSVAGCY
eukprot:gene9131-10078_t